jgi:ribosomal protein S18 acetylase RimI-like enzyme
VFDRPDRLVIGDVYVLERYRGTGLARELVDRAGRRARESGCAEVRLEADVDNDRALAFYEKLGFETVRYTMSVSVESEPSS